MSELDAFLRAAGLLHKKDDACKHDVRAVEWPIATEELVPRESYRCRYLCLLCGDAGYIEVEFGGEATDLGTAVVAGTQAARAQEDWHVRARRFYDRVPK